MSHAGPSSEAGSHRPLRKSKKVVRGGTRRIWNGNLCIGDSSSEPISCVAIQYSMRGRASLRDTTGWPSLLRLESCGLKTASQVLSRMGMAASQWYVRFAAVDERGKEKKDSRLDGLLREMVQRKVGLEIECREGVGTPGTLYLCSSRHGNHLMGVFRPTMRKPVSEINRRIWSGEICARRCNDPYSSVSCAAFFYPLRGKTPLRSTTAWPSKLVVDLSNLRNSSEVLDLLNESSAQWCVRFAAVDASGAETSDSNLDEIVAGMKHQGKAAVVECNADPDAAGTLYLWIMRSQQHGFGLMGMFLPKSQPEAEMGLDQRLGEMKI